MQMIGMCLNHWLANLPSDGLDDKEKHAVLLNDMGAVVECWRRCEAEAPEGRRRAEAHEYFKVTRASHIIFQCGVEFGAMPSSEDDREARRAIIDGGRAN